MADRVLVWHIPKDAGYAVSLPRYYADADYEKTALRVFAEGAPVMGDLKLDIRAAGVSIFANQPSTTYKAEGQRTTTPKSTPVLLKGDTEEVSADDFNDRAIEEGELITCVIDDLAGATGITISLELRKVGENGEAE